MIETYLFDSVVHQLNHLQVIEYHVYMNIIK